MGRLREVYQGHSSYISTWHHHITPQLSSFPKPERLNQNQNTIGLIDWNVWRCVTCHRTNWFERQAASSERPQVLSGSLLVGWAWPHRTIHTDIMQMITISIIVVIMNGMGHDVMTASVTGMVTAGNMRWLCPPNPTRPLGTVNTVNLVPNDQYHATIILLSES